MIFGIYLQSHPFYALSNRMASFLSIKPNDEFHQIGRLIKKKNK